MFFQGTRHALSSEPSGAVSGGLKWMLLMLQQ